MTRTDLPRFLGNATPMVSHSRIDFPALSLTEGGPGDAVMRRLRLAPLGPHAARTSIALATIVWVPLLLLSAAEGLALRGPHIPFVYDLSAHVRFLIALPVLLLAEVPIGTRLRNVSAHFLEAGLVRGADREKFVDAIRDAVRFRDSRVAELVLIAVAYVTTYNLLFGAAFQAGSTWYAPQAGGSLTPVGFWYAFVSLPIFQFLLFRWIYRMLVWARFLRRVSTLDLELTPTHPDGAAGLAFLGKACIPFGVILFALSAVLSSAIASRILFEGARLEVFQPAYAGFFVLAVVVFVSPLLVFIPTLMAVKHKGLHDYGLLATEYTQRFQRKWIEHPDAADEPLLGTADIQSLADLASSYELIEKMRPLPIRLPDFVGLVLPGVIPALPLALTVMPLSDIAKGLLRLLA